MTEYRIHTLKASNIRMDRFEKSVFRNPFLLKYVSTMDFVIANQEKVNAMIKTTLKIDGMMCGMCESHMNDLIRKNFQVKKVTSSAKDGETVIISDNEIDIPWAKKEIKEIGYELVSYKSEPYEKKGFFHFGK